MKASASFTILHILVINAVNDMVIMAAISITAVMAIMHIKIWMASNVARVTFSLVGLVDVFHIMTPMAVMMYWN